MLTDAPPRKASHHAGFLESDRIKTLDLPQDGRLLTIAQSVESAVKAGTTAGVRRACAEFLDAASEFYRVPACGIRVLSSRPLRVREKTWMVEAGANPKDVQGQMRHSRISTTMDIYAQFVPESQRRALAKMSAMVESRTSKPIAANTENISMPPQSRMVN
jgi:hypothetical protein